MSVATGMQIEGSTMVASDNADLTILYGSQTGNAEYLAHQIRDRAAKDGRAIALASLEEWLHASRPRIRRLLVVTSTHDNGHMPDNAAEFWDWLGMLSPGALDGLPFAVLSIGDSMYEDFCKAGHDIESRLEELGAIRVVDGIDCDVDFEFTASKWSGPAVESLLTIDPWEANSPSTDASVPGDGGTTVPTAEHAHAAHIVTSQRLSKPGSAKEVMHYELAFDDGPFEYEPGDSISVFVTNSDALVGEWLRVFGDPMVSRPGGPRPLHEVLTHDVELRLPHPGLIVGLSRRRPDSEPVSRVVELVQAGREQLDAWLWGRDVLDALTELQCLDIPVDEILAELRPLQPRDYSISSSPLMDDGRVHLTVNGVQYNGPRGKSYGAATVFLKERSQDGVPFSVRRLPAHDFRLPGDEIPVIMIGPGVGVAPFRAFLRQREALGATGRNWLFFGDQHREFDWLYEDEFKRLIDEGLLSRLDVAFSRDQDVKRYVQHEMLENADEIRAWIAAGAYVFVCGDKTRMAPDVDRALATILSQPGGSAWHGQDALAMLKSSARYVKDVY